MPQHNIMKDSNLHPCIRVTVSSTATHDKVVQCWWFKCWWWALMREVILWNGEQLLQNSKRNRIPSFLDLYVSCRSEKFSTYTFFKLGYNSHTIKSIPFKGNNSAFFLALYNHHNDLISEHFYHPHQRKPMYISSCSLFPLPPTPGKHESTFCFNGFTYFEHFM